MLCSIFKRYLRKVVVAIRKNMSEKHNNRIGWSFSAMDFFLANLVRVTCLSRTTSVPCKKKGKTRKDRNIVHGTVTNTESQHPTRAWITVRLFWAQPVVNTHRSGSSFMLQPGPACGSSPRLFGSSSWFWSSPLSKSSLKTVHAMFNLQEVLETSSSSNRKP